MRIGGVRLVIHADAFRRVVVVAGDYEDHGLVVLLWISNRELERDGEILGATCIAWQVDLAWHAVFILVQVRVLLVQCDALVVELGAPPEEEDARKVVHDSAHQLLVLQSRFDFVYFLSTLLCEPCDLAEGARQWTQGVQVRHVHFAGHAVQLGVERRRPELAGVQVQDEARDAAVWVAEAEFVPVLRHWLTRVRNLSGLHQFVERLLVNFHGPNLLLLRLILLYKCYLVVVPFEDARHHFVEGGARFLVILFLYGPLHAKGTFLSGKAVILLQDKCHVLCHLGGLGALPLSSVVGAGLLKKFHLSPVVGDDRGVRIDHQ